VREVAAVLEDFRQRADRRRESDPELGAAWIEHFDGQARHRFGEQLARRALPRLGAARQEHRALGPRQRLVEEGPRQPRLAGAARALDQRQPAGAVAHRRPLGDQLAPSPLAADQLDDRPWPLGVGARQLALARDRGAQREDLRARLDVELPLEALDELGVVGERLGAPLEPRQQPHARAAGLPRERIELAQTHSSSWRGLLPAGPLSRYGAVEGIPTRA